MSKKLYAEDINDLVQTDLNSQEEFFKGRGADKQKRKARGTGPRDADDYSHHSKMAGYHESREKHHARVASDFKSSSDKELHESAKHHEDKVNHHAKESQAHAKKRDSSYSRDKHGADSRPKADEAHAYGRKYFGKD